MLIRWRRQYRLTCFVAKALRLFSMTWPGGLLLRFSWLLSMKIYDFLVDATPAETCCSLPFNKDEIAFL